MIILYLFKTFILSGVLAIYSIKCDIMSKFTDQLVKIELYPVLMPCGIVSLIIKASLHEKKWNCSISVLQMAFFRGKTKNLNG